MSILPHAVFVKCSHSPFTELIVIPHTSVYQKGIETKCQ